LHGGLRVGALWRGKAKAAPRPLRRFVLISSGADILSEVFDEKGSQRRWMVWALPEDLAALLAPAFLAAGPDIGYIQTRLEHQGVRRDIARRWPQPLGFRIVRRLAERGRIAYALLRGRRELVRSRRVRVQGHDTRAHRIGPDELLRALQAAGLPPEKAARQ
jgi:hypothetical protein